MADHDARRDEPVSIVRPDPPRPTDPPGNPYPGQATISTKNAKWFTNARADMPEGNDSPMPPADQDARPPAAPAEWRCFHCDELFADETVAREHFGSDEWQVAGCILKLNEGERLLLGTIRELQGRNNELLHRAQEAEYDAEAYSGLRSELKRYFGASDAWTCWNRMDEKQGEIEALRSRVAALSEERDEAHDVVEHALLVTRDPMTLDDACRGRTLLTNAYVSWKKDEARTRRAARQESPR